MSIAQTTRAHYLPELVRRAFREALTGRPGPVHLDVPQDVLLASREEKEKPMSDDDKLTISDAVKTVTGRVVWSPKEDITTYELARAITALFMLSNAYNVPADIVAPLPDEVRRHFRIE